MEFKGIISIQKLPFVFFFPIQLYSSSVRRSLSFIVASLLHDRVIVATKLMLQVTLSYSKQATTTFTQFAYTSLTWSIYSLVANNLTLSIIEQTLERYNERNLSDLLIETDDEYIDLYLEWKKEHPMQMATPMPEWI